MTLPVATPVAALMLLAAKNRRPAPQAYKSKMPNMSVSRMRRGKRPKRQICRDKTHRVQASCLRRV